MYSYEGDAPNFSDTVGRGLQHVNRIAAFMKKNHYDYIYEYIHVDKIQNTYTSTETETATKTEPMTDTQPDTGAMTET